MPGHILPHGSWRKPTPGPYELPCALCWKREEYVVFDTMAELTEHLRNHFIDAAPARIIASA